MVVSDERRSGQAGRLRRWRAPLAASAAALALLWLPAVVEEWVESPGNVTRMIEYFAAGEGEHAGVGRLGTLNARVARAGECRCGVVAFPQGSPDLDRIASVVPQDGSGGRT
jgi:hypothetical protein